MPVTTRTKIKELDRVAVTGTITRLTAQPDGRVVLTVDIGGNSPVTLDAVWTNQAPEALDEGDQVRLEGRVERINRSSSDAKWDTASLKLDGYPYRVTLPTSGVAKA